MQKSQLQDVVASAVSNLVESVSADRRKAKFTAMFAASLSIIYAEANGNDADFAFWFGNGLNGKKNVVGRIREIADEKTAKLAKDKRDDVAKVLRTRLYEARALREAGGMPAKDESVQAALKRYKAATTKEARPEGNETASGVIIADSATLDEIADALSVWVAKHGAASAGLVAKLADFLPVTVKRRKSA